MTAFVTAFFVTFFVIFAVAFVTFLPASVVAVAGVAAGLGADVGPTGPVCAGARTRFEPATPAGAYWAVASVRCVKPGAAVGAAAACAAVETPARPIVVSEAAAMIRAARVIVPAAMPWCRP